MTSSTRLERGIAAVNSLVGYDFFTSYAWADGRSYAEDLRTQLSMCRKPFRCFLDSKEMGGGAEWRRAVLGALKRSAVLVIVGVVTGLVIIRLAESALARVVFGVREEASGAIAERRSYSDRFIAGTGRAVGHIASLYEGDRVVRFDSGALALSRTPDSFAVLMARALRPEVRRNFGRIAWLQKVDPNGWVTRWVNVAAQHPFRMFYGEEIVDNPKTLPVRALAGRLVIITSGFSDVERHRTPLTALSGEAVPPILVQAQAAAQLLDGRTVGDLPARTTRLMLFTLALMAGIVGWYRGLRTSIAGWLLALVALVVADVFAYSWLALTLPAVQMIAAWFLGEAAGRGLRRILVWEEANGRPWPIEDTGDPGIFSAGTVRKEQA